MAEALSGATTTVDSAETKKTPHAEEGYVAAPGVTLVQTFTYRGNAEEWSNTYHFVGDAPSDDTGWRDLVDSLAGKVAHGLTTQVTIIRAYCYEDTDDDAVFVYDMLGESAQVVGQVAITSMHVAPGDVAAWIRWKTSRTNSKGHPIYLRKYYHSVLLAGETGDAWDQLETGTYKPSLETVGTDLNTSFGDWPGIAGPDGVAPGAMVVSTYTTTRTLKRRGKRP